MDQLDTEASIYLQSIRRELQIGMWNTGKFGESGYVVSEPLNVFEDTGRDSIKRYTDRYLPRQQIGITQKDFDFQRSFLPPELYKAVGLMAANGSSGSGTVNHGEGDVELTQSRLEFAERTLHQESDPENGDEEKDDEDGEEELEDEFEELEDDDYNAEKYFDDGDDYWDGDDGGHEAAY